MPWRLGAIARSRFEPLSLSIYYLQKGRAKLTVVSTAGKEATITLLSTGDFVGEESLAAVAGLRMATATAITACTALKIERAEMIRVMHEEHAFSDRFLSFLLAAVCGFRRIWSISSSTLARSAWPAFSC
ncbi:MAG: cyclic nucleotide-binding domain-containing protein [Acidobacteriaceae bacterium]